MPMSLPVSMSAWVMFLSSADAVGSPEGWLWTRMMALLDSFIAGLNTSLGWMRDASSIPMDMVRCFLTLFLESRRSRTNCSLSRCWMRGAA